MRYLTQGGARRRVALLFVYAGLPACVALTVSACGADSDTPDRTTVRDSAGVRIIELAEPPATDEGGFATLPWALRVDQEVGELDGPDAFGRLRDVAPRVGGGVWVVDGQTNRVHAYDADGRRVASHGATGAGPGEFLAAASVTERPDGRIVVAESRPPRLSWLDDGGALLERRELEPESYRPQIAGQPGPRPPLGPTMASWKFAPDGSAVAQAVTLDAAVDEIVRSDVLLGLSNEAAEPRRLASWQRQLTSGGPQGATRLLDPVASWTPASDGGAWLTPGDRFEIRRLDAAGRVTRILRLARPRVAIDAGLERRLRARLAESAERPSEQALLDRATFPDSLPAIHGLWASGDAELWVGVLATDRPWELERPNAWEIVDAEAGRVLGRLPIPEGFRPTRVTRERVFGIFIDELGVTRARAYRIER